MAKSLQIVTGPRIDYLDSYSLKQDELSFFPFIPLAKKNLTIKEQNCMLLYICYILEHRGCPCKGGTELGLDSECEKRDR